MSIYYVNENHDNNGFNEVHRSDCSFLSFVKNKKFIGAFNNGVEAVKEAKKQGYNADGCYYCCNEAHHG